MIPAVSKSRAAAKGKAAKVDQAAPKGPAAKKRKAEDDAEEGPTVPVCPRIAARV